MTILLSVKSERWESHEWEMGIYMSVEYYTYILHDRINNFIFSPLEFMFNDNNKY